jgi:hypothetical protein
MLFVSDAIYEKRQKLMGHLGAKAPIDPYIAAELLKLDPWDYIALNEIGQARERAGDLSAAEQYFWRAAEAHPTVAMPYLHLARVHKTLAKDAFAEAFSRLAIRKGILEHQDVKPQTVEKLIADRLGPDNPALEAISQLSPEQKSALVVIGLEAPPANEPADVTERMKPWRILDRLQSDSVFERDEVDEMIAVGPALAPLLVGLLRDWAQGLLNEDDAAPVENALALLGEIGTAAELEPALELLDVDDTEVGNCAQWAIERIMQRFPRESIQALISTPELIAGPHYRLAIALILSRNRAIDPEGELFDLLTGGISKWEKDERNTIFPMLLSMLAIAGGASGFERARAALKREGRALSADARSLCEAVLDQIGDAPPMPGAGAVTVYDICAGEAEWPEVEDDEFDDDEDFDLPLEPVRKADLPGRNDPCWCNSGKKYKKCHLEADERAR